ncbi:MAG: hypothetical protein QF441_06300 [Bacteriovoracaceae bacterium]|jgi:uncharacterized membrane protein SirB2|nr:hypothetical protein [Halobacteriovoraceae bacterium]MDP7320201.1 hypothetical protein [Bacteriovoracaceae bacterium]
MSYQFYKMLHVISIVVFFSLYAVAAYGAGNNKKNKIITGIMLLVILVGGMGLKKFAAPGEWPLWLNIKMVIWLIVGVFGHVIVKRFPEYAVKSFWISIGLLTLASYLANYKL